MQETPNYKELKYNKLRDSDMMINRYGVQDCYPGYTFGPAVRDFYSIHYILKGKGTFTCEGKTYSLEKDDGFLISPGKLCTYSADIEEPWTYTWVGFCGFKARYYLKLAGLDEDNPIFTYSSDDSLRQYFHELVTRKEIKADRELFCLGNVYHILNKLAEGGNSIQEKGISWKEIYIKKAIEFMEFNYSGNITIAEVAEHVGLNHKYLSSLFKKSVGVSPKEFLICYRMERACELLKDRWLTIGDVARSAGYSDQFVFSRTFKKRKGLSPKEYRVQQR